MQSKYILSYPLGEIEPSIYDVQGLQNQNWTPCCSAGGTFQYASVPSLNLDTAKKVGDKENGEEKRERDRENK